MILPTNSTHFFGALLFANSPEGSKVHSRGLGKISGLVEANLSPCRQLNCAVRIWDLLACRG